MAPGGARKGLTLCVRRFLAVLSMGGRDTPLVAFCQTGRERPQELFGRFKARKVGSLPPSLVHFPPGLFEMSFAYLPVIRVMRTSIGEERGEGHSAEGNSYFLHLRDCFTSPEANFRVKKIPRA
jgi:hypothetical protein